MMSRETKKLKVEGLPLDITKDKIKVVFQNAERKGGGLIERVEVSEDDNTCTAVITFETSDAVNLILSRGNEVEVFGTSVIVEPVFDDVKNEMLRSRETELTANESDTILSGSETQSEDNYNMKKYLKENVGKGAKPKVSKAKFKAQSPESSSSGEKSTRKSPRKKTALKQGDDHEPAKKSQAKSRNTSSKSVRSQKMTSEKNKSVSERPDRSFKEEIMPWETTSAGRKSGSYFGYPVTTFNLNN